MKNIQNALIIILAFVINMSCDNDSDERIIYYCTDPIGDPISDQLGRIYRWQDASSNSFFYYIGNPDVAFKGAGGILCNDVPREFRPKSEIGILVTYSGIVKAIEEAGDPLFSGIEIYSIKIGR